MATNKTNVTPREIPKIFLLPNQTPAAIINEYNITVFARIDNGIIHEITFDGEGCAISQASASLMTELMTKKSIEEAQNIINMFLEMLQSDGTISDNQMATLGDICALSGVKKFPMRIKCATLAWHAANDIIQQSKNNSSTQ